MEHTSQLTPRQAATHDRLMAIMDSFTIPDVHNGFRDQTDPRESCEQVNDRLTTQVEVVRGRWSKLNRHLTAGGLHILRVTKQQHSQSSDWQMITVELELI